ncbi:MAG: hypothetical protein AB4426_28995 [Xenococcaceae cyanobacterium]
MKGLIAAASALVIALPAAAQVGPGMGPTDYIYTSPGSRNVIYIGGGNPSTPVGFGQVCTRNQRYGRLNLRRAPSTYANPPLVEIPNRVGLNLYGGVYGNDNFWWWYTRYGNNWGWVRADYVCGDPQ